MTEKENKDILGVIKLLFSYHDTKEEVVYWETTLHTITSQAQRITELPFNDCEEVVKELVKQSIIVPCDTKYGLYVATKRLYEA
jgi:hypothetical protein